MMEETVPIRGIFSLNEGCGYSAVLVTGVLTTGVISHAEIRDRPFPPALPNQL